MEKSEKSGFFSEIIKGGCTSIIIALIAVLIFAFVAKAACLNSGIIKSVNQFIKVVALFTACLTSIKQGAGLIKGGLIGGLFCFSINLIFMLCGTGVAFNASFFLDLIFTVVIGCICGIVAVNAKK